MRGDGSRAETPPPCAWSWSGFCPPRRQRPVNLSMPKINAASDLIAAASALTEAAADGEIAPGEAASLSQLVANKAKAVETFELADRLARLEERISAKGSTP